MKDCAKPDGYVEDNTDCDDSDMEVNPGAEEICCNGKDDDCNGLIDENATLDQAIVILQRLTGINIPSDVEDINGDGKIALAEVIYVLQKIAGLR